MTFLFYFFLFGQSVLLHEAAQFCTLRSKCMCTGHESVLIETEWHGAETEKTKRKRR